MDYNIIFGAAMYVKNRCILDPCSIYECEGHCLYTCAVPMKSVFEILNVDINDENYFPIIPKAIANGFIYDDFSFLSIYSGNPTEFKILKTIYGPARPLPSNYLAESKIAYYDISCGIGEYMVSMYKNNIGEILAEERLVPVYKSPENDKKTLEKTKENKRPSMR